MSSAAQMPIEWQMSQAIGRFRVLGLSIVSIVEYFDYAADLSVGEADLYSMRVSWRIGKQVFNNADGLFARALVLF